MTAPGTEESPRTLVGFTADAADALNGLASYANSMEEAVIGLTEDIGRLMEALDGGMFTARGRDDAWRDEDYPFIARAIKIYKEANS